jgi:tetratricopeptide (TPR) repeat protein
MGDPFADQTRWPGIWLWALLLSVVTVVTYLPSLNNGFTNWDDPAYVVANTSVRDLSVAGVKRIFSGFQIGNYHPLTVLSYAIDFRLFGTASYGWHVSSLLLHVAASLAAFRVMLLLGGGWSAAFAGAAIFALHPLRVEPTVWISARRELLAALFFFAALEAYLRSGGKRRRVFLAASFILLLLSLLSLPMGVSFPLVALLVDRLRRRRIDRVALLEKVPHALLCGVFAVLAIHGLRSAGVIRPDSSWPWYLNLFVSARSILHYLGKTLLPVRLSALYPLPVTPEGGLPLPFLLAPFGVLLLGWLALLASRRSRETAFATAYAAITLLPVLHAVPFGFAFAADRYTYFPALGLSWLAGLGCARLAAWSGRRGKVPGALAWMLPVAVCVLFAGLARQRARVWGDSVALWDDVLQQYPYSFMARGNRANALVSRGEFRRALADHEAAIALTPPGLRTGKVRFNRSVALIAAGDPRRALADLDAALAEDPNFIEARGKRGAVRADLGDLQGAIADFDHLLRTAPQSAVWRFSRGKAFLQAGDAAAAAADFDMVIALEPDNAAAWNNRGAAMAGLGDFTSAERDFSEALALRPAYPGARDNLERARAAASARQ